MKYHSNNGNPSPQKHIGSPFIKIVKILKTEKLKKYKNIATFHFKTFWNKLILGFKVFPQTFFLTIFFAFEKFEKLNEKNKNVT